MSKHPFELIPITSARSTEKPRATGRTMMIDWGWDIERLEGLLRLIGPYIDMVKVPIGTPRLYEESYLADKVALFHQHQVKIWFGGGFVEHVYLHHGSSALPRLFEEALRVGFDILEISDNYVPLSTAERQDQIRLARESGLTVYGEVGSKHTKNDAALILEQCQECLEAGAEMVVLEGAEFFDTGRLKGDLLEQLKDGLNLSTAVFELVGPWISGCDASVAQDLAKALIAQCGADVNLGNVMPDDILHTEALRVGLGVVQPTEVLRR